MHDLGDYIEMHAVPATDPDGLLRLARAESNGLEIVATVALMLAEMVGLDLEDG